MSVAVSLLVPGEVGSTSAMRTFLKPEKGGLGRRPPPALRRHCEDKSAIVDCL